MSTRLFDPAIPSFERTFGIIPDTEDRELTTYLERQIEGIFSQDVRAPACPHCGHRSATLRYKGRPPGGIPYFTCDKCRSGFNRRTGTALEGFREREKLPEFIRLLSQQRPLIDASRILGVTPVMVKRWVNVFRAWLLKLDPDGYWEAKVRLGIKPGQPDLECPKCGDAAELRPAGFYYEKATGRPKTRKFRCAACKTFVNYPIPKDEHVPHLSADAVAPRTARGHQGFAKTENGKGLIREFNFTIPLNQRSRRPRQQEEDRELTAFLTRELAELYSLSEIPPACPRCGGHATQLHGRANTPKPIIPFFYCQTCNQHFRRTTGTPFARVRHRNLNLPLLIKLMSLQYSANTAANLLGIKATTVRDWVKRIRAWLLQIDSTGYWERKIRLGLEFQPDFACIKCGAENTLFYRGYDQLTGERKIRCRACHRWAKLSLYLECYQAGVPDHIIRQRPPSLLKGRRRVKIAN